MQHWHVKVREGDGHLRTGAYCSDPAGASQEARIEEECVPVETLGAYGAPWIGVMVPSAQKRIARVEDCPRSLAVCLEGRG